MSYRTSVVTLRVSLGRVSAFLLDKDAFEGSSCASILYHHWFLVQTGASAARVLLLLIIKTALAFTVDHLNLVLR
jgi:hypothetical protein